MEENYKVYKHIFPNNKIYIGITKQNLKSRWNYGNGYNKQPLIFKAIQKYKWENIEHEILYEHLTKKEAEEKEIELIKQFRSNNRKYGYNIENGGHICKVTEETRKKHRIASAGKNNGMYGKKLSLEQRQKISERQRGKNHWNYGKKWNEEAKAKMSKSHLGKKMSAKAKGKMRLARLGELNPQSKKVEQYDLKGNFITSYISLTEAATKNNCCRQSIGQCCLGKLNQTGGYIWKYKEVVKC